MVRAGVGYIGWRNNMPNKEVLNILNRIKGVSVNDTDNIKLILNKEEAIMLCNYLKELRDQHNKETDLIMEIHTKLLKYYNE